VHYEKDIQLTKLGELFQDKISQRLGFEVIASNIVVCGKNICCDIKEKGVSGGMFGTVSRHEEKNICCITDDVCRHVWEVFCECVEQLSLPQLMYYDEHQKIPYELHVTIYDFVKRSRFGYFMDYAVDIERALKKEYADLAFSFRINDDIQYYYLIFHTEEDRKKAEEIYGIENMNLFVWNLCKKDDEYHVFDEPLPAPIVTTKQEVIKSGKAMGIMRNNLGFSTL
jgi:hypothetical protein